MRGYHKAAALLTAAVCMLSALPALAEGEEAERVEIGLRVGEQTININGEEITAEAPYIAGDGVTLVPVRVISEAFGAEVEWDEAERGIKISYSSVTVSMWLGSTVAEINGIAQQLEYPPELTGEGVTMVPLRFISESFGAVVSYDEQTQTISVILGGSGGDDGIISGISESRIGDAYFGWMMDNPTGLTMNYRSANGMNTSFSYMGSYIEVSISRKDENYDFDRDFAAAKASFKDAMGSLVYAEKNADKSNMSFVARDSENQMFVEAYVTDDYFMVITGMTSDDEATSGVRGLIRSFVPYFDDADTYDVSGLEDGKRKYELEDIEMKLELPPGWTKHSAEGELSRYLFRRSDGKSDDSSIIIEVYSKNAANVRNASWLSAHDLSQNKKTANPEVCSFSGLVPKTYNSFSGYEYTSDVKGTVESDRFQKDVFFDMGGYVYNISFFMRNGETESEIDEILNSITVSAPDAEKLGNLMRAGFEYDDGYYKASDDDMTVTLPYSFEADSLYGSGYMDTLTGVEISANGYAYFEDFDGFGKSATEYVRKADIIKAPAIETIDGKECCTCTTRSGAYYIEFYAVNTEKGYYDFAVRYPELMYSEANRERVRSIITSAEFK